MSRESNVAGSVVATVTSETRQNTPTTLSRRQTRALVERAGLVEKPAAASWSAKRIAGSVLGGLGALGMLAAFAVPAATALIGGAEPAIADEGPSEFQTSLQNAQAYAAGDEIAPLELHVGSYEAYVEPPPEPEPEPEPVAASTGGSDTDSSTGSSTPAAAPSYSGGGSKEEWMAAAGIAQSDWGYVDYIVSRESGWNPNAVNSSSGASGLVQALPCGKVPGNCFDPVDNLRWGNGYAVGRYGSWANAYAFWTANHWW